MSIPKRAAILSVVNLFVTSVCYANPLKYGASEFLPGGMCFPMVLILSIAFFSWALTEVIGPVNPVAKKMGLIAYYVNISLVVGTVAYIIGKIFDPLGI